MKKAGSRILIITFGIMAAIAILYPWKFVPEYGILQMTESGEKAGKTAESQESDEEYMQVADHAVEALFTGDTDTLLSLLPERYFGQYGETLQWIIENAVEEELQKLQDEVGDIQITHWPVRSEKQSEGNMEKIKSHYGEEGDTVTDARNVFVEVSASGIEPEEMEIAVVEIDGKWYLDFEGWDDGSEENYDDEDDEEDDDDDGLRRRKRAIGEPMGLRLCRGRARRKQNDRRPCRPNGICRADGNIKADLRQARPQNRYKQIHGLQLRFMHCGILVHFNCAKPCD